MWSVEFVVAFRRSVKLETKFKFNDDGDGFSGLEENMIDSCLMKGLYLKA